MTINDFELEFGVNDFEFEIDTSTQTQVNEQANEFQTKTKQEEMEEELKKNIDNLPKYATEALNALDEKEKIDKAMDEKIEILSEIRTPHEKRNFIEERINVAQSDENIKEALNILSERELDIISRRFGLNNYKIETQKEIAKSLGISRSYVSRIEKRALTKLYLHLK